MHRPHHVTLARLVGQGLAGGRRVRGQAALLALHPFPVQGSYQHVVTAGPFCACHAALLPRHPRETQAVQPFLGQAGVDGDSPDGLLPLRALPAFLLLRLLLNRPNPLRQAFCLLVRSIVAFPEHQAVFSPVGRCLRPRPVRLDFLEINLAPMVVDQPTRPPPQVSVL